MRMCAGNAFPYETALTKLAEVLSLEVGLGSRGSGATSPYRVKLQHELVFNCESRLVLPMYICTGTPLRKEY